MSETVFMIRPTTIIFILIMGMGVMGFTQPVQPESFKSKLFINQNFIEQSRINLPVDDPVAIFSMVFFDLSQEIVVYPTENYFYFQFYGNGKWYWGNIRLDYEDRDDGLIHFAYYNYIDDPKSPEEGFSKYKRFGPKDGVKVEKSEDLIYEVSYLGRTVVFKLNPLDQTMPPKVIRHKSEHFVFRTQDESGFVFLLVYNKKGKHFMWVLDEDANPHVNFEYIDSYLLRDKLSGFVFYQDKNIGNRKILVGVWAQNIRRNNYWDGPFDQLADNFCPDSFKNYITKVYPGLKGKIDGHGKFLFDEGSRLAITPYYEYETLDELKEVIFECATESEKDFYPCIAYDVKVHIMDK